MTGVRQPAAQLRRLKKLGLPAWINAENEVCLTMAALQRWDGPSENEQRQSNRPKIRQLKAA
jgi:hypothetical protein